MVINLVPDVILFLIFKNEDINKTAFVEMARKK